MVLPEWPTKPIPGVSLSAGGLLALADLSTIAQRTAITGGSSWLDSLLLAPGLHYQQAADELVKGTGAAAIIDAVEDQGGKSTTFRVNNAATAHYIQKIARPGQTVTLDVGAVPTVRSRHRLKRSGRGMRATVWAEDDMPDLGWVSHLLYLISPALTVAAIVLVVLLRDWWTLGLLLALMLSRVLNIWVIKQRALPREQPGREPADGGGDGSDESSSGDATKQSFAPLTGGLHRHSKNRLTEYTVSLADGRSAVRLRGMSEDLQAITAHAWLRSKTHTEGYLEAMAKLLVYMVAALSGNMTQAGAIVMMALLLSTAGLLALSNANAKSFKMNGRVAAPEAPGSAAAGNGNGNGNGNGRDAGTARRKATNGATNDVINGRVKWDVPPYRSNRSGDSYVVNFQLP
ncbi:hypothetical protein QBC46DRAFT_123007 [Diplogelasinospora grovesii]|uniref:Uncharacterized protein n=1 Tax=Diplogelasinospora grovesii TaxID=303347 RepID=A0AAN6S5B1_9PEZI|nr:hypothetical protein QBC46DRAFT_123007 [Diplogelasinospora grovesii]